MSKLNNFIRSLFPSMPYTKPIEGGNPPYQDSKGQWWFWSFTQNKYIKSAIKPKGGKK